MPNAGSTRLVLAAMIFAVAMTFIDQTIVSLAIPELQKDLGLSATGTQWIINAYLLSLSALFAFGGRLADIAGHRRMVVIGVVVFAVASALCGLTPTGEVAEAWMIVFRVIQGAGAAIMFPAALAIVVAAFPMAERGKALAIFFGITGGLTAVGPFLGGYLTEWTWRAIFWVNVPVAIIALILIYLAKPDDRRTPAAIDWRGTALIAGGMALSVLGLQQSSDWGWTNPATIACIAVGLLLLLAFVRVELRTRTPLIDVNIFRDRGFAAANGVLFLFSMAFIPVFFFTSEYAQISVGDDASSAGLFLLVFFAGFGGAAQWGGKVYDEKGVRAAVIPGCALGAVGFFFWARALDDFQLGDQWIWIVMAGAGCGLILGPASTDALNRVAATRYGEATGITQTVRNFGASIGLAVLGTILIMRTEANVESSLGALGVPSDRAHAVADALTSSGGGRASGSFGEETGAAAERAFAAVRTDFANATETVFYVMAGIMAALYVLAHFWLPHGRVAQAQQAGPAREAGQEAAG
ncbi:MAG TPA: MFS transporter [Miltoncostaeaceae bacterium]|nr:MFS transporter [Miltoncostaeaceae bacterium]